MAAKKLSEAQQRVMDTAKSIRDMRKSYDNPKPVQLISKKSGNGHATKATLDAMVTLGYLEYVGLTGQRIDQRHTYEVTAAGWAQLDGATVTAEETKPEISAGARVKITGVNGHGWTGKTGTVIEKSRWSGWVVEFQQGWKSSFREDEMEVIETPTDPTDPTPDGTGTTTTTETVDLADPAFTRDLITAHEAMTKQQYDTKRAEIMDVIIGNPDQFERAILWGDLEALGREYDAQQAAYFMAATALDETQPLPTLPDLDVYEPIQAKVVIPVVVVTEPNAVLLEAQNKQLRYERDDARKQVQDRLKEVFELQKRLMAYSMAQTAPSHGETLVDEITIKTATLGFNGKAIILSGNFTDHIESGTANRTNIVGNIQAFIEHKILFNLAGYMTTKPETLIGARMLANKDVNRRVKAVRSATTGEWFSFADTNELKSGDVIIDTKTGARETVKKVVKDTRPNYGETRTETHYSIVFEDGTTDYSGKTARHYLVWTPETAAERLAA